MWWPNKLLVLDLNALFQVTEYINMTSLIDIITKSYFLLLLHTGHTICETYFHMILNNVLKAGFCWYDISMITFNNLQTVFSWAGHTKLYLEKTL